MRSRKTQNPKPKTPKLKTLNPKPDRRTLLLDSTVIGMEDRLYLPEVSHLMRTTFATLPRWWTTVAALTVTAVLLSPFYWVLIGSFMTPAELFGGQMSLWPKHFAVENWSVAFGRLWPHIQNSLFVSAAASIGAREDLKKHPFIGFVDELFAAEDYSDAIGVDIGPRIRSTSILAQLHATSSGSGLCMLPAFVASSYPMLVPVLSEQVMATRSFHMHIHEDHRRAAPVREVAAFIAAEVQRNHALFQAPTVPPAASREDIRKNQRL